MTNTTQALLTISPMEAKMMLDRGEATLVDVREADEFAAEHIPGSTLMPLSGFSVEPAGQLGAQQIIFHCKSGRRSADAARMAGPLCARGIRIFSLDGGIEGWKAAGNAVQRGQNHGVISIMRQVQIVVGILVLLGTAGGFFLDRWFLLVPAMMGLGLTIAGSTGTCGLAVILSKMPWNRTGAACKV